MSNYVDLLVPPAESGYSLAYEPLDWVKKNCRTYITNDAVQKDGEFYYRFYFGANEQGERDRLLFILRWL